MGSITDGLRFMDLQRIETNAAWATALIVGALLVGGCPRDSEAAEGASASGQVATASGGTVGEAPLTNGGGSAGEPSPAQDGGTAGMEGGPVATADGGAAVALCDGSDEIRIGAWGLAGVGGVPPPGSPILAIYMFMSPYGHDFLFINGRCEYHARGPNRQAVVSGVLTVDEAGLLALETGWPEWEDWSGYRESQCPDSVAGTWIAGAGGKAAFLPGCPAEHPAAPEGLERAIEGVHAWAQRLGQQGTPLSGPLSAVAYTYEVTESSVLDGLPRWPLDRPLTSVAGLVHEPNQSPSPVPLSDPSEVALLRGLRAPHEGTMWWSSTSPLSVFDADRTYNLYMRDELPAEAAASIEAFMGRVSPQN